MNIGRELADYDARAAIARQIMEYARWEPGMLSLGTTDDLGMQGWPEDYPFRYVDTDLKIHRDETRESLGYGPPDFDDFPDLDDRVTVDILFGQLEERFAAVGWDAWARDTNPRFTGASAQPNARAWQPGIGWTWTGPKCEVLLAGFRKVAELEGGE